MPNLISPTSYLNSYSLLDIDLGMVEHRGHSALLQGQVLCGSALEKHNDEAEIRDLHTQWSIKLDLCPTSVVEKLAFWQLWTDCARNLSPAIASIIADYCLFYAIFDDIAESFFGNSVQSVIHAENALNAILQILKTGNIQSLAGINYEKIENLCQAILDLRQRILSYAQNDDLTLLLQGFDAYRRGVLQQIYLSRANYSISRETQIYNRQLNVAFDPTVILMCMLTGVNLGQSLDRHPLLERSHILICRLGGVINDIISFPKETSASDQECQFQNLIAANYEELVDCPSPEHNPLKSSILKTFAFHNLEMREFLRFSQYIAQDIPSLSGYFPLCVAMHRSWMSWCLNSPRYRSVLPEDRPLIQEKVQPMNRRKLNYINPWLADPYSKLAA